MIYWRVPKHTIRFWGVACNMCPRKVLVSNSVGTTMSTVRVIEGVFSRGRSQQLDSSQTNAWRIRRECQGGFKVCFSFFSQSVENYFWVLALVQLRQIYICWKHCGLSAVSIATESTASLTHIFQEWPIHGAYGLQSVVQPLKVPSLCRTALITTSFTFKLCHGSARHWGLMRSRRPRLVSLFVLTNQHKMINMEIHFTNGYSPSFIGSGHVPIDGPISADPLILVFSSAMFGDTHWHSLRLLHINAHLRLAISVFNIENLGDVGPTICLLETTGHQSIS